MGWWKMAIFHLKHSYLNWRVIPCKKKKWFMYMQFFIIFSTFFCFLDSYLDLIEFFKCMTWQSIFLFSFLFFHDLFTLGNDVCHRWLSKLKHHFSCEDCFGFWLFGPKLFIPLLSTKRVMVRKCFREMGNFGQHASRHQSKMISRYYDLGILFMEKVWQVWNC